MAFGGVTGIGWGENFPVLKTCITNITVEMEGFDYKFQFRRFFSVVVVSTLLIQRCRQKEGINA